MGERIEEKEAVCVNLAVLLTQLAPFSLWPPEGVQTAESSEAWERQLQILPCPCSDPREDPGLAQRQSCMRVALRGPHREWEGGQPEEMG